MAYNTLIFVALYLVCITSAAVINDFCPCDNDIKDEETFWRFLKKLSVEVPEEERDIYAVIPGELSPVFSCECADNFRRKRSIAGPLETQDSYWKEMREKIFRNRGDCPEGHVKFGSICIVEEFLNYDY